MTDDGGPSGADCDGDEGYYVQLGEGSSMTYQQQHAHQTRLDIRGGPGAEPEVPPVAPGAPMEPGMAAMHGQYVAAPIGAAMAAPPPNGMHPGPIDEAVSFSTAGVPAGQPLGPVEWKMLEIDVSAAASLKELSAKSRVWTLKLSELVDRSLWKSELSKSNQRVGGLEIVEAEFKFPFKVGVRLVLPDASAPKARSAMSSGAQKGSSSSVNNNKLPAGKYIVTSKEPVTFSLGPGQKITSKNPVRVLVAPETLERSILSSYGNKPGTAEPIWTPGNLRSGISKHPKHVHTLSMVDANHPIMHQIEAEKKRIHGSEWKMNPPGKSGLCQVANVDIDRHVKLLLEDWSKSIKMKDLMDLEIQIERSTVEGKPSGDDMETLWTNPAEICDGIDLTSQAGKKAMQKIVESSKKYRFYMTLGIEYADVY